jgi:hypothetical protein
MACFHFLFEACQKTTTNMSNHEPHQATAPERDTTTLIRQPEIMSPDVLALGNVVCFVYRCTDTPYPEEQKSGLLHMISDRNVN